MLVSGVSLVEALRRSGLMSEEQLALVQGWQGTDSEVAEQVVRQGWITRWQAQQLLRGRTGFELKKYVLLEQVGEGGMGAVFKARQRGMDRLVAIKLMKNEGADQQAKERFLREIATLGAVNHPNIVAALDADQIGEQTFLVMDYVEGKDLKAWLTDYGRLPLDWACEVIMQAALGLQHAHEKGLVHRDIKPSNILIVSGPSGEVPQAKILDLGLARFTEEGEGHNLTQTGQVMGTVDYMSPEQARSTKHVDIRADIFSLGCTLFKLLSGEIPYPGNNVMEKLMARTRPAPLLSSRRADIPPVLDQIVARMLAVKPEERYSTPLEVAQALAPFSLSESGVSDESSALVVQHAAATVMDLLPAAAGDSQVDAFLAQLGKQEAERASGTPKPQGTPNLAVEQLENVNPPQPLPSRWSGSATLNRPLLMALAGGIVVLLLGLLGYSFLPHRVSLDWPVAERAGAQVWLDGQLIPTSTLPDWTLSVSSGPHELRIVYPDYPPLTWKFSPDDTPQLTIPRPTQFPLTAEAAKTSQQRWASYLRDPVEKTNSIGMSFVLIPPGKFTMGSPPTEKDRLADREAQVDVTLTQPFWLGKYEVTQAEYQQVIGQNPSKFKIVTGYDTSRFPVEQVSWTEATEYCRKLTEQERAAGRLPAGWEYRLPTEAQWEYACRAGTTTATAFGDSLSSQQANFDGKRPYNGAELGPKLDRTTTVGSYPANAWGLHDMHGNVWEFCQDWFGNKLPGGIDPLVTQSAAYRVLRGGSWFYGATGCQSAIRDRNAPYSNNSYQGFRVALVPAGKTLPTIAPPTASNLPSTKSFPTKTPSTPSNLPLNVGTKAGEEWNGNALAMPFCWCPAGKGCMGSPETQKERDATREAQVEVTLTQGFWLGKYEVTQAEYERVMGKNPSHHKMVAGQDTSRFPVEQVNWTEAEEYCRKLTEQERTGGRLPEGWEYRLPTEAQWEYACRAGTTTATAFGDSLSSQQANFPGDYPYNVAKKGPTLARTTLVGSYPRNAWGLHDMHGNVKEWCQDWFGGKLLGGVDPTGASTGSGRVDRGGSWNYSYGRNCRSAVRNGSSPDLRIFILGFRAAIVLVDKPLPSISPPTPSNLLLKVGSKAGEEWNGNALGMKFCWCPPGKFTMGSPITEKERDASRESQVEVTLTQGFWLGKYEVTQAEYQQVIGQNPSRFKIVTGYDTSRFPVEQVNWKEAEEYCQKLTEQERAAGRLPAEWEFRLPSEAN